MYVLERAVLTKYVCSPPPAFFCGCYSYCCVSALKFGFILRGFLTSSYGVIHVGSGSSSSPMADLATLGNTCRPSRIFRW
jgi:hypothetical protein